MPAGAFMLEVMSEKSSRFVKKTDSLFVHSSSRNPNTLHANIATTILCEPNSKFNEQFKFVQQN